MPFPAITIITVSFNAGKTIERTIQSVLSQTYGYIEFIIVDGASNDNTMAIINKYKEKISKIISEKDNGLYDAMNKGLKLASGDYLLFLNADDTLYSTDTIEEVFKSCPDSDVIYGEAMIVDEKEKELGLRSINTPHQVPENLTWKSLKTGMVVSHQAFIVKRTIAPVYDLKYKVCSDIDWMIKCLKSCKNVCNTHEVICNFRTGGTSRVNQTLAWKERYQIFNTHYGIINNFFNHIFILFRYIFARKKKGKHSN